MATPDEAPCARSPILIRTRPLTTQEAVRILKDKEQYKCIEVPPNKPKGGELFLYDLKHEEQKSELGLCTCNMCISWSLRDAILDQVARMAPHHPLIL